MKFTVKSICTAIALLSVAAAAQAEDQTATVGGDAIYILGTPDPNKPDRALSIQSSSATGTLTYSNTGADYAATNGIDVGGAVGAFNVGGVLFTGFDGLIVKECWKSFASSGSDFVATCFGTKGDADSDPKNQQYIDSGELRPPYYQSFRLDSAATSQVNKVVVKTAADPNDPADTIPVGSIRQAKSVGYMIQSATTPSTALTGGTARVRDITFDLYNGTVSATVNGKSFGTTQNPSGTTVTEKNLVLWTFNGLKQGGTDISGPTFINPDDFYSDPDKLFNPAKCGTKCFNLLGKSTDVNPIYTLEANTKISNLVMTRDAITFFTDALGLLDAGSTAIKSVNDITGKWGSVESKIVMQIQEVPEPSTYALMGLGLLGISSVVRRRKAQS